MSEPSSVDSGAGGIAYVIDEVFAGHRPPSAHPERPERIVAVTRCLRDIGLDARGIQLPSRPATEGELGRVHAAGYIDELSSALPGNSGWLDPDTYFSPGTWDAALAAAGGAVDVTRAVMSGRVKRGLAAVRPPGHHAEADTAMGFCLFNNIAVAARIARDDGAARVAIVDWDVHHGNGTQHMFYSDPSVLFMSVHQYPFYPGTGAPDEIGSGDGRGATINVALPAGCGDADYDAAFDEVLMPALRRFAPDLVLVSAGFDGHAADPVASMRLSTEGYGRLTQRVCIAADAVADGRVVAVLEGGYDLDGLAGGVAAMVEAMESAAPVEGVGAVSPAARAAIERTKTAMEAA